MSYSYQINKSPVASGMNSMNSNGLNDFKNQTTTSSSASNSLDEEFI